MKYQYIDQNFSKSSLELLENANRVIDDYTTMGYSLTLRQLYYQMVVENLIPNQVKEYRRLARVLNDGRWAGLVDWEAIEDRVRETVTVATWTSPKAIVKSALYSYKEDYWENQNYYVEVFCEKDAVSNIIEPVCRKYRVRFTANRGYPSLSLMRDISTRLEEKANDGKEISLIYFGDFDPSGLDMDRDIEERLKTFSEGEYYFDFERVALIRDQIDDWNIPPNPAKQTDSRFAEFNKAHGNKSWELDAIRAEQMASLVEECIMQRIDDDRWAEAKEKEEQNKATLSRMLSQLGE